MSETLITKAQLEAFNTDGAVCLPGLFRDWVDILVAGIEKNMAEPGPYAAENLKEGENGRFFDDYCNWRRISEFSKFVQISDVATAAGELMGSERVQMFHEHVLVKEPGTSKQTPWHQDSPYYFVEGQQTVSFWIPLDPVKEATLRVVAGSHKWPKPVLPTRWLSEDNFYASPGEYMEVPDPDSENSNMRVLEWSMEPGDAVAFHYKSLHGARGNLATSRRRAFSLRLVGDDARYVERPGPTSPPFPDHQMVQGQKLREDWFPYLR